MVRFRDQEFPAKIKIGVSGCPRCCGENHTRDIGIMGTNRGWTVFFGGNGGTRPRFGDRVARDLSTAEALDCVQRLAEYYRGNAKGARTDGPVHGADRHGHADIRTAGFSPVRSGEWGGLKRGLDFFTRCFDLPLQERGGVGHHKIDPARSPAH